MRVQLLVMIVILPAFAVAEDAEWLVNLLQNPSIEKGDDSPAKWEEGNSIPRVEYSWEKTEGFEGKSCLCITKTANRYFPFAAWTQTIERTGDSPMIQVSAQIKAKDATKAVLDVLFLDAEGKWISHEWATYIGSKKPGDPRANLDWKRYSGSVMIPPKTKKIAIGLQHYGPGTVWFDDVTASYAKRVPQNAN